MWSFKISPDPSQISPLAGWGLLRTERHCLPGLCEEGWVALGDAASIQEASVTQSQSGTNFKAGISRSAQDLPVTWAQSLIRLSWSAWFPLGLASSDMPITSKKAFSELLSSMCLHYSKFYISSPFPIPVPNPNIPIHLNKFYYEVKKQKQNTHNNINNTKKRALQTHTLPRCCHLLS